MPTPAMARRRADQEFIDRILDNLRAALERAADLGLDFRAEERPPSAPEAPACRRVAVSIEAPTGAVPRVFSEELATLQRERRRLRPAGRR